MPRLAVQLVLALIVLAATSVHADALVQCAKVRTSTGEIRNGTPVRLREVCKSNETEVDLTGPAGEPGLDGQSCWDLNESFTCDAEEDIAPPLGCGVEDCAGAVTPPERLVLIDANGVEVGEFPVEPTLDQSTQQYLFRAEPDAEIPVTLAVTRSTHLVGPSTPFTTTFPDIAYTTPDCTGQPYVTGVVPNAPEVSFYPGTFTNTPLASELGLPGTTVFYYLTGVAEGRLQMDSRRRASENFNTCIGDDSFQSFYLVGALAPDDFPVPYRIESR